VDRRQHVSANPAVEPIRGCLGLWFTPVTKHLVEAGLADDCCPPRTTDGVDNGRRNSESARPLFYAILRKPEACLLIFLGHSFSWSFVFAFVVFDLLRQSMPHRSHFQESVPHFRIIGRSRQPHAFGCILATDTCW
jgi:hypothetical protein